MDDNEFWVAICKQIAAVAVVITVTTMFCEVHRDNVIGEMVQSGANPIDAACAAEKFSDAVCVLRASK